MPSEPHDTKPRTGGRGPVASVAIILADTTWRMAVPTLMFAGAGLWGDVHLSTRPWLTIAGTIVGFVLAALLINRQLKDLT